MKLTAQTFQTKTLIIAIALTGLGFAQSTAKAVVNYSDGNFGAPWTVGAQFILGPGVSTESAFTLPSGGNPAAFYEQRTTFPNASGSARNGIVNAYLYAPAANYDPSLPSAAILSLDFSIDTQLVSSGGGVADAAPLLEQGGNFYTTALLSTPNFTWTNLAATGLTASSFGLLASDLSGLNPNGLTDFTQNPDFSSSGAPISFGFLSGHSTGPGGPGNDITEDFDNWNITLNTPDVKTPEPASALLLLAGLATRSRRRNPR